MAYPDRLGGIVSGKFTYFNRLADHCAEIGLPVHLYDLRTASVLRRSEDDFHLLMTDKPSYAPNTLVTLPHYLNGYWYLDELAPRHHSTLRLLPFDADSVPLPAARQTFRRLRAKFVEGNRSKYQQAPAGADLPQGLIAIFCQELVPSDLTVPYVEQFAMIDAVITARADRPVYIKPHPLQSKEARTRLDALHRPEAGVHVTDASIHDLLAAAAVSVTQCSAVAFEGYLHRTPALLCGQTDFHHIATVARHADEIAAALDTAIAGAPPFVPYLHWHMSHLLQPKEDDFLPRFCARVRDKGFDLPDPVILSQR
ncbi:hypothetical protein [Roseobacter sp. HKCCA0434]|uniref:hypothetical protein n=1 Tax=Roseobacter sp. HKCCA0434 TaxID=3079297 RepID=UPI002905DA0B|nr:hypothetical protein [Roseobacter sp. HKCCA0434]